MKRLLLILLASFILIGCKKDTENYAPTWGYTNGYAWIDLGLPSGTKWATQNVGAPAYYKRGNCYNWAVDVVQVNWGSQWRMPNVSEMQELLDECKWKYTTENGVGGYKVKGPNGNSRFMPTTGYYDISGNYRSDGGAYWSSTQWNNNEAYYLDIIEQKVMNLHKMYGFSIRPVTD